MNSLQLSARPLLVVMNVDWFSSSAVQVTMSNLLKWFRPDEFVIAHARTQASEAQLRIVHEPVRAYPVLNAPFTGLSWSLDQAIQSLYFRTPIPSRALSKLANKYNCGAILAVYPDLHAVAAAQRAAASLGFPFCVYLHDTIVEAVQGSAFEPHARRLQADLFSKKHLFFSMSEGLAELLLRKYNLRTVPLPHCYNERPAPPVLSGPDPPSRTALFAGNVYAINRPAVARAARAAIRAGYRITFTSQHAAETMIRDGVRAASVSVTRLPSRAEYLASIRRHDALFIALAWPEESHIHRDELATIFPTKVPEYLGAGRPILIHCPEDYFVAAFFRKHECGLVVSDRREDAILAAWIQLRDDADLARRLAENSYRTVSYFAGERISDIFRRHIEGLIGHENHRFISGSIA